MAGYTRQSVAQIINGENITAPPLNAEFNQLVEAFSGTTGHSHDGSLGNGPKLDLRFAVTNYLQAANGGTGGRNNLNSTTNPTNGSDILSGYAAGSFWYNTSGDRWWLCVDNSQGAAVWRELLLVETGSQFTPSITGAVDLGSLSFKFKDAHFSGTVNTVNADLSGALDVAGISTFDGNVVANANATFGGITNFTGPVNTIANLAATSGTINNVTIGGATAAPGTFTNLTATSIAALSTVDINAGTIDSTVIGGATPAAVTGTTVTSTVGFAGDLTGNVTGNVTGNLTGNTAGTHTGPVVGNITSAGTSTFNNVTISGTLNMDASTASTITGLTNPVNPSDAATKSYVDQEVNAVIAAAPGALDTLNELAAAINDDANFATTVTNNLATKLNLSGGTMSGAIDMGSNRINNVAIPAVNSDAANKAYVDTQRDTRIARTGDTMSGQLNMNGNLITSVATPININDAANKSYVDSILGSATSAASSASSASSSAVAAANSASNAQQSEDEAEDWANLTTSTVAGTNEYSAKEYAIGTQIRGTTGSAKDWASYTGGTVDGTDFSAKYWATQSQVYTIQQNIDDINLIADDLSAGNFVAGQIYDFGSITEAATGQSGAPDGFIITVANNLADVQIVSAAITNVNTVAGISSNVTTVAGVSSQVSTLAAISSDVSAVAPIAANVSTVAGISSDVTAVSNNNSNINTVAGQITPNNNISTLAGIAGNISTVAGISVDVTTVSNIQSAVSSVATNNADISTVAAISADVTAVAGISSQASTIAANISDVTNFADVYQGPKSTAPSLRNDGSALQGGDLYFDTVTAFMRYYDGSAWANITAPTGDLGNQNSNDVNITGGNITGIVDLAIVDGGTGASSAPAARNNLGLGEMATQQPDNVAITGGTITGINFDFGSIT